MPNVERRRISIDISTSAILRIILVGIGLVFLYIVRDIILYLFLAIIIASAINPAATWLRKFHIPRAVSVLAVYIILVAVVVLTVSSIVPPLTEQVGQLGSNLPSVYENFSQSLAPYIFGERIVTNIEELLVSASNQLGKLSGNILATTRTIFGGFFSFLVVLVLAFYFTVDREAMDKFIRTVSPAAYRPYVQSLMERIEGKLGRWLRGQIILSIVIGLVTFIGLSAMGVQYALVLALLAGLLEIIPVLGPILAAIPAIILAFIQAPVLGLVVLVFYIVVQQLENHILVPQIMKRAVGLNPVVVIIALLIGARLAGILGVLIAIPLAAALSVFLSDIFTAKEEQEMNEFST